MHQASLMNINQQSVSFTLHNRAENLKIALIANNPFVQEFCFNNIQL